MRTIIFLTLLLFINHCNAQLGLTKVDVIKQMGDNYVDGDKGNGYYMAYATTSQFPDPCEHCGIVFLFDNATGLVLGVIIKRPISEINDWVKRLDNAQVKKGDLVWRDYQQNTKTEIIKIKDEISITISHWKTD